MTNSIPTEDAASRLRAEIKKMHSSHRQGAEVLMRMVVKILEEVDTRIAETTKEKDDKIAELTSRLEQIHRIAQQ